MTPGWRMVIVLLSVAWGILFILPNWQYKGMDPEQKKAAKEKSFLPTDEINYGLDIQGGLHLVMGVSVEDVIDESTRRLIGTLQNQLKGEGIVIKSLTSKKNGPNHFFYFETTGDAQNQKMLKYLEDYYPSLQMLEAEGTKVQMQYYNAHVSTTKKQTVEQSIETLRNRIDEFGVSEPSITAQGDDRILVQLPGIENAEDAKELINKTAKLEFLIVSADADMNKISQALKSAEEKGAYNLQNTKYSAYVERINKDLQGVLPKNTKILFEKGQGAKTLSANPVPYVVELGLGLGGNDLKSSRVSFGQFGDPEVGLSFNAVGGKKFADVTEKYIGRQMAVILDDVVKTAPSLRVRIGGGEAVIELGRGNYDALIKEATLISTALRAGALPAKLEQLEERTVGPTLGADSIAKGKTAILFGGIGVLLFMLFWYKAMGVIANIALALNCILILAILTSLHATLTLPGVAGIALTIGMAVDANVIIFERIKEELLKGLSLKAAVKEGYARALSAILDANITTAATSIILMYYGTGPVRGFAVTLLIGIITSLFTAVFVTRSIIEYMMVKHKVEKIAI